MGSDHAGTNTSAQGSSADRVRHVCQALGALSQEGELQLAGGISRWHYTVARGDGGGVAAVILDGIAGLGSRRRIALLAAAVAPVVVHPAADIAVEVAPLGAGWQVVVDGTASVMLGDQQLVSGRSMPWPEAVPLHAGGVTIEWCSCIQR